MNPVGEIQWGFFMRKILMGGSRSNFYLLLTSVQNPVGSTLDLIVTA